MSLFWTGLDELEGTAATSLGPLYFQINVCMKKCHAKHVSNQLPAGKIMVSSPQMTFYLHCSQ